jgi:hypothetical protein
MNWARSAAPTDHPEGYWWRMGCSACGGGPATPWGAIMYIDEIIEILEHPRRADKSAVGAINRPLLVGQGSVGGGAWRPQGAPLHFSRPNQAGEPGARKGRHYISHGQIKRGSLAPARGATTFLTAKSRLTEHYECPNSFDNVHNRAPTRWQFATSIRKDGAPNVYRGWAVIQCNKRLCLRVTNYR